MLVRVGENGWEPHAEVLPKHQRKGLGTAMWQYAEKLVGEPLEPGLETTQAGQRLINKLLKEPK